MNIIVTGGATGLGKIIVESLLDEKNNLIVIDKKEISYIEAEYLERINYYQFDFEDINKIEELIEKINGKYKNIDLLINNVAVREFKYFDKFSLDEIIQITNINFLSILLFTNLIYKKMLLNNCGRIINISSVSALEGYSSGTLYCSTKAALVTFTEALKGELKTLEKNVTINTILPDSFKTRENEKLKDYDYIIETIILLIKKYISSNRNGEIKIITPLRKRIKILVRLVYLKVLKQII